MANIFNCSLSKVVFSCKNAIFLFFCNSGIKSYSVNPNITRIPELTTIKGYNNYLLNFRKVLLYQTFFYVFNDRSLSYFLILEPLISLFSRKTFNIKKRTKKIILFFLKSYKTAEVY